MRTLIPALAAVILAVTSGCGTQEPGRMPVTPPAASPEAAEVIPDYSISPSSAFSRRLRGVFVRPLKCSEHRIKLGDSIDVEIKEAWLEKIWEPKGGGLLGEPDYANGYALDTATSTPRTQLVVAITPSSKLGHFDNYSWSLADADDSHYRRTFGRTDNVLHIAFKTGSLDEPHKFYIRACRKPGELCEAETLDSLTFR